VGENLEIAALRGGHPQGGRQSVQDLGRWPYRASLLKKGVVRGGKVRQQGDFLTAQTSRAPAVARGQANIARSEPLAPRPKQLSQGLGVSGNSHAVKRTHAGTSKTLLWLLVPPARTLKA
jgi:hypothetical protein